MTPQPAKPKPLWKRPDLAMETPMRFTPDLSLKKPAHFEEDETKNDSGNLHVRLRRIKLYNEWCEAEGLDHHKTKEEDLKLWLVRGGFDHELSKEAIS